MSSCMNLVCLAEAQALTAHRAGQKGTKASVTSSLHLGSSSLFEQAAKVLREQVGEKVLSKHMHLKPSEIIE